jgi:hypothetical protein
MDALDYDKNQSFNFKSAQNSNETSLISNSNKKINKININN